MHRLEENLGAARIELTADDLSEIDRAASQIEVHGARYPDTFRRWSDGEHRGGDAYGAMNEREERAERTTE